MSTALMLTPASSAPAPPSGLTYVGVNGLNGGYSSVEQPFLNLFKQASSNSAYSTWYTQKSGTNDTNEEAYVVLDADGYPTSLTASPTPPGGQLFTWLSAWMNSNFVNATGALPPGASGFFPAAYLTITYRLQFQGKGTINIPNITNVASSTPGITITGTQITSTNAWGTLNSVTFQTTHGMQFQITALPDSSNYIKAVTIVDNAYAALHDAGQLVHPLWKAMFNGNAVGAFSRLRMMNAFSTNFQDLVLTFGASGTQLDSGAVSGTLTAVSNGQGADASSWWMPSGVYPVLFATGQVILCTFTHGSSAVTWSTPLSAAITYAYSGNAAPFVMAVASPHYGFQAGAKFGRPLPSNASYQQIFGLPLEVAIQVCNELNCDPWINIPLITNSVDTTYASGVANMLFSGTGSVLTGWNVSTFSGLSPNRKAYIELGNEIWNFSQPYRWNCLLANMMGVETGFYAAHGNNQSYGGQEWYGTQLAGIGDAFFAVYGGATGSRVRVTAGGQFAIGNGTGFLETVMNTPNWSSRAYTHHIGAISFAPYFGANEFNSADAGTVVAVGNQAAQLNELFSLAYTNKGLSGATYASISTHGWVGSAAASMTALLAVLASQPWASVEVACYEGGAGMDADVHSLGSVAGWATLMTAAIRDSRMALCYFDPNNQLSSASKGYLKDLKAQGVNINQLNFISTTVTDSAPGYWGGWGAAEVVTQTVSQSNTPKLYGLWQYAQNG